LLINQIKLISIKFAAKWVFAPAVQLKIPQHKLFISIEVNIRTMTFIKKVIIIFTINKLIEKLIPFKLPSTPPPVYNPPEDPAKFPAEEASAPPQYLVETQENMGKLEKNKIENKTNIRW
jgi:hypothetical protein